MAEFTSNKVVVVGKYRNYDMRSMVQGICAFLQNSGFEPHLEKETKDLNNLPYIEADRANPGQYGLCIAIGGDGTMLGACRSWGMLGIPVLGINQGRVGFLTDISAADIYEHLGDILKGRCYMEKRNALKVSVLDAEQNVVAQELAVNDFVCRLTRHTLMHYSVFVGKDEPKEFFGSQRADGLIVATPTGSTAYALPAGGSILMPESEAFILAPICPQSLANRPVVIPDVYKLKITCSNNIPMQYVLDGVEFDPVDTTFSFLLERHETRVTFVHHCNYSYFEGLRKKLQWS